MTTKTMTARRWATTGTLAVLGAAVTLATWAGGQPNQAVMLAGFYVLCCGGVLYTKTSPRDPG
jgi:hypothetical protein